MPALQEGFYTLSLSKASFAKKKNPKKKEKKKSILNQEAPLSLMRAGNNRFIRATVMYIKSAE